MATTSSTTSIPWAGGSAAHRPHPRSQAIAVRNRIRVASKAEYIQAILGSLELGMVLIDGGGRVEWVNPTGQRMLGGPAEDIFSGDAITADDAVCHVQGEANPVGHRPTSGPVIGVDRPDGRRVWLSVKCCLLEASDQPHPVLLVSFTSVVVQRDQLAAA
jgi:PAS domain-containing protein